MRKANNIKVANKTLFLLKMSKMNEYIATCISMVKSSFRFLAQSDFISYFELFVISPFHASSKEPLAGPAWWRSG